MSSIGAVMVGRNDDYGENLVERFSYCITSMLKTMDEIVFVDWNTPNDQVTLIEELGDIIPKSPKLRWVRITPEQASEWTYNDPDAQAVCEVMARNIGLRRLSTEYLVSTNIDVICPPRHVLEPKLPMPTTFITTAKRNISLYDLRDIGLPTNILDVMTKLQALEDDYGQQPAIQIREDDFFSVVSSPGDFQIAHRDLWYRIRGFEERLYKKGYTDTNIQKKASMFGFEIAVNREIPIWHIGHEGGWGGSGGINDMDLALTMKETTNTLEWGHAETDLEIRMFMEERNE